MKALTRRSDAAAAIADDQQHEIGAGLLLGLVAGRAIFRVILYAANFAALAAWSTSDFNRYAAASGALAWCIAVVQNGPEKSALTLLPRARRARSALAGGLLGGVRLLTWATGAAALVAILVDADAPATLFVVVAAQLIALGLNLVAVAVQRALGRPHRDIVNFALLSGGWLLLAGLALGGVLGPVPYVMGQFALAAGASELTSRGTPSSLRAFWSRPSVRRLLGRTVMLMGLYDVGLFLATSSLFAVLPFTGYASQSGQLYLVVAGWAVLTAGIIYVLRVYQPRTSLQLAGGAAGSGRALAQRVVGWSLSADVVWLVAAAALIVTLDLRSVRDGLSLTVWLLVLLASRLPMFLLVALGIYVLENSGSRALRTAGGSAVAGLVGTIVAAAVVVPYAGAIGAVWALGVGELSQAVVVLWGLNR